MNIYSLLLTTGVLVGIFNAFYLAKKINLDYQNLLEKIALTFIIGLIGARITYIFLYPSQFLDIFDYFALWEGGLVSIGGMIFGFLVIHYLFKGKNRNLWLDIIASSFFLGWIFGRIGGFLTSNTLGNQSELFGQFFANRIPTTLFESVLALGIYLISRKLILNQKIEPGLVFFQSLLAYFFGRFVIDFFRQDPTLIINLKLGQLVSLIIIVCVIMALEFKRKRGSKFNR